MESKLRLSIEPGYSVNQDFIEPFWKFIIGMPLNQAIDIISNESSIFKKVDFLYSHKTPTHLDIVLTLIEEGIKLFFNPMEQRLIRIEFNNFFNLSLLYCNSKFNDLQELPTKERVMQVFGPAKIPEYDAESKSYLMSYLGLNFQLAVPSDSIDSISSRPLIGHSSAGLTVRRMTITTGSSTHDKTGNTKSVPLPAECLGGGVVLQQAKVLRSQYRTSVLELDLLTSSGRSTMATLWLGQSCQEVLCSLGAPSHVFYKTEDRTKVHSVGAGHRTQRRTHDLDLGPPRLQERMQARKSDYFYNYLTLGMDIMFRYEDDRVSKFILHTNFPDDFLFNTYYRCMFTMDMEKDGTTADSEFDNTFDSVPSSTNSSKFQVTTFTKWSQVQCHTAMRLDPVPVEVSRFQDHCHKSGFDPAQTLAYGVDDVIFEVMPENDHISALTLYEVTGEDNDM